MNRQLSRYLDLLRVLAALLVLLAHLCDTSISDGKVKLPDQIGYSSVMIFFVLSGYVISYVAAEREHTLSDFAISRIARVYSVVIPALVLTVFVDILFLKIPPLFNATKLIGAIPLYQYAKFPKYVIIDLLFGNEIFGFREKMFSNGTYWSMCLEVYYYVIFASAFYLRGNDVSFVLLPLLS